MNTTEVGDILEERLFELFRKEIDSDRFWAKKSCCKIFRKKAYYSKDRGANIVFDIAIEIYLPNATEYSMVVFIECKNYKHSVPVDDAEEFFAKVQQIAPANSKAVIASTASFQSGTRNYAKSKGVGLIRYFDPKNFKWELRRSSSAGARSISADLALQIEKGICTDDFKSEVFDLYMQSPIRETNSLWDFLEDIVGSSPLKTPEIKSVSNSRSRLICQVPYLEKGELESRSAEIVGAIDYVSGEVSLEAICDIERSKNDLKVIRCLEHPLSESTTEILGRITFEPLEILIYPKDHSNRGRERFTLAHELAHHFLDHGRYIVCESCDENDLLARSRKISDGSDIARMEFQANFFAASLLMPRENVLEDFRNLVCDLQISNRGHGALYVDHQPCNVHNYEFVIGELTRRYAVSRSAATIRLESLGLLYDARSTLDRKQMPSVIDHLLNADFLRG
jgi:Zn-dependent peptidase ImmA (M78 family)